MRKHLTVTFIAVLLLCFALLFVACNKDDESNESTDQKAISVTFGDELQKATGVTEVKVDEETNAVSVAVTAQTTNFDLSSLDLSAVKGLTYKVYSDESCTVEVTGEVTLTEGANKFYIVATVGDDDLTIPVTVTRAKSETTPSNPENPSNPDTPSNPNNPDNPDNPDNPSNPSTPEPIEQENTERKLITDEYPSAFGEDLYERYGDAGYKIVFSYSEETDEENFIEDYFSQYDLIYAFRKNLIYIDHAIEDAFYLELIGDEDYYYCYLPILDDLWLKETVEFGKSDITGMSIEKEAIPFMRMGVMQFAYYYDLTVPYLTKAEMTFNGRAVVRYKCRSESSSMTIYVDQELGLVSRLEMKEEDEESGETYTSVLDIAYTFNYALTLPESIPLFQEFDSVEPSNPTVSSIVADFPIWQSMTALADSMLENGIVMKFTVPDKRENSVVKKIVVLQNNVIFEYNVINTPEYTWLDYDFHYTEYVEDGYYTYTRDNHYGDAFWLKEFHEYKIEEKTFEQIKYRFFTLDLNESDLTQSATRKESGNYYIYTYGNGSVVEVDKKTGLLLYGNNYSIDYFKTPYELTLPTNWIEQVAIGDLTYLLDFSTKTATLKEYSTEENEWGQDFEEEDLISLTIPSSIVHDGITYTVTALDYISSPKVSQINLPETITSFNNVFINCPNLTAINVSESNPYFCSVGGVVFNKDMTTLVRYPMGKIAESYTIPNSVTTIGVNAFIEAQFKTLILPSSITRIETYGVAYCKNLEEVELPNGLTYIGREAFSGCSSLETLTLPSSVTFLGETPFIGCTSLTAIDSFSKNYVSEDGVLFNADKTALLCYPAGKTEESYTLPESVTKINYHAFQDCTTSAIIIPDGVEKIQTAAFMYSEIVSISIPKSINYLDSEAFWDCKSLISITYAGTKEEWASFQNGYNWFEAAKNCTIHCTDGDIIPVGGGQSGNVTESYRSGKMNFYAVSGIMLPDLSELEATFEGSNSGCELDIVGGDNLSYETFETLVTFFDNNLYAWSKENQEDEGYINIWYTNTESEDRIGITWDKTNENVYVHAVMTSTGGEEESNDLDELNQPK